MPIRILSDEVSSAIAAGEVVERPASVVKELFENAIDAEAELIQIAIAAGGKALIEVTDDGWGIPAAEVQLAVRRHTTSKLETINDLDSLQTLGFRGEALASIAAVSRMDLSTRAIGEAVGTALELAAGEILGSRPVGTNIGTSVRVRDLYYNVPARKRFLKADRTERTWISRLVTRYAMAYPKRRIGLTSEGRTTLHTSGNGSHLDVIAEVYGVDLAEQMIRVPEASGEGVSASGFVGPPFVSRSNRREISLFLNGRWIQDASITAAVIQAYHTFLMVGRYPIALIFIEVPPDQVDLNVHPAKAEIRLADPGRVFSIVQRAVRATLLGQSPVQPVAMDHLWRTTDSKGLITPSTRVERTIEAPAQKSMSVPLLRPVGQVGATYLVAEGPDGVYLIDQHAAHERILFERMMAQVEDQAPESQGLLEPESVELTPPEFELIEANLDSFSMLGFLIEPFGERTMRLRAVPALISNLAPELALRVVLEDFEEDEAPLQGQTEARLAARVCKRAAVKSGQVLSLEEQRQLIRDLEQCATPRTCPHGRPTMVHLSVSALERQFGRRGA